MTTKTSYPQGEFCWVDLMAHDIEAAKKFYGGLLDWQATDMDTQGGPPYVQFTYQGQAVAGMGQMMPEMKASGMSPVWNSYIAVDDVEAAAKQAAELGATIVMPPMKVLEAGSMAVVQDPTGAHVSLWQAGQHFGASLVNVPNSFSWNELATRDEAKAREFYSRWMGWEFEKEPNSPNQYWTIANRGRLGGGMMLMSAPEFTGVPPHWAVYFAVADADATAKRAEELGGKIHVPPFDISVGRIAILADPHGGMFDVIAMTVEPD